MPAFKTLSRLLILGAICLAPIATQAQTKITMPYSPIPSFLAAFVAGEEGYFKKRGLDVEMILTPNNGAAVAAIAGGSAHIGTVTPTALLQAAANGLDVVAIEGAEAWPLNTVSGLLVKADSGITSPAGLAGRKLAVPGLNGTMDLLLRRWLRDNNIKGASIVEIGIATTGDAIRQGTVDAGAVADPFYSRAMAAGNLTRVADFFQAPAGAPAILYASTKAWAAANPKAVSDFRASIREGAAFVADKANEARVREILAKYTKLPPPVVATLPLPSLRPQLQPADLAFWITAMTQEGWLDKPIAAQSVILP